MTVPTNPLAALQADQPAGIEEDKDILGGYEPLDTDVYEMTIKHGFITFSGSKAMAMNLDLEGPANAKLKTQFYMTSGEDKGCKTYFEKKDGTKAYLPGYNQANAVCMLTLGISVAEMKTEKKVINLYDSTQKKEVPTEVDMFVDLIGQKIKVGVFKQEVSVRKKNESTGKYEATAETRIINEVDKIFCARDQYAGLTLVEVKAQKTEPEFMQKWLEKWKGVVRDRTEKPASGAVTGGAASQASGAQAPKTNLFK